MSKGVAGRRRSASWPQVKSFHLRPGKRRRASSLPFECRLFGLWSGRDHFVAEQAITNSGQCSLEALKSTLQGQNLWLSKEEINIGHLINNGSFRPKFEASWRGLTCTVDVCFKSPNENEEQILQELKVVSILRHPSVLMFLGAAKARDAWYILTEYSFITLEDLLSQPNVTWQVYPQALQVAQAMSYIHGQLVLHRELSPTSIVINSTGQFFVGNFSKSVVMGSEVCADTTFFSRMSPQAVRYAAPEISASKVYGKKADVFAYGLVLYVMLAHKIPLEHVRNPFMASKMISLGMRPSTEDLIHTAMVELLKSMWAQEADKRPSFLHIVDSLEKNYASKCPIM